MTPQRSLLRIDLKDSTATPSTPIARHLGLVSVSAGVMLAVYVLFSAPWSSTIEAQEETAVAAPPASGLVTETEAEAQPMLLASLGAAHSQPAVSLKDAPSSGNDAADYEWVTATVKRRDTLSQIFMRHGLNAKDAYMVAGLEDAAALRRIRPGQKIQLAANAQDSGALAALRLRLDDFSTLHIAKTNDGFKTDIITRTAEVRLRGATAVINSSLLGAAKRAGIENEVVYDLAQMFGWQVDFSTEIQTGDRFSVIFEELYLDDKKVGAGDILAAELIISNRRLEAVRHVDEYGRSAYYAANGDGIRRSILRSPLEFGRVTSQFAHKRMHPILKRWRAHRGVDYGAPHGTPVRSTGDGVVTVARFRQGYGNTVSIRHGIKYTTLYAHLSRFAHGVKSGARVRQGQVIGYVGNTGWATGAHLHYEFRVNGAHRDPLTVELPNSDPIADPYKRQFLAEAGAWMERLSQLEPGTGLRPLAQLDVEQ